MVSQPWPIRPATEMYNVSVGKPRPGLHGEQGRLLLSKAHGQAGNTITSHRQRRRLGRGWEQMPITRKPGRNLPKVWPHRQLACRAVRVTKRRNFAGISLPLPSYVNWLAERFRQFFLVRPIFW